MDDTEQPLSSPSADEPTPARWYYLVGERRVGPLGLAAVRRLVLEGTVATDTLVWADGMPDWLPAARVPALIPPPDRR